MTPRQRQEIYALNRVMTKLENERFLKFCLERGYRGDRRVKDAVMAGGAGGAGDASSAGGAGAGAGGSGYDIFM